MHKVDKKSVLRLVRKLFQFGLVKNFSVIFCAGNRMKENKLYVDLSVKEGLEILGFYSYLG